MELTPFQIFLLVALYLLAGQVFSLCYVLVYKPEPIRARLGLIGLFWVLVLIVDLLLAMAHSFGSLPVWVKNKVSGDV